MRRIQPPTGPSLTRLDTGTEPDINAIMAKGRNAQGQLSTGQQGVRKLQYGVMPSESFHQMLNQVTDMQMQFRGLNARIRARFGNSPEIMLRWLENMENHTEAIKMGLLPDDPENPVLKKTAQQIDLELQSKMLDALTPQQLQAQLDKVTPKPKEKVQ